MSGSDLQVLISCMHQENVNELVKASNLRGQKVLIVNQINIDKEKLVRHGNDSLEVKTPTRGLSVSRNIAIEHSSAKICLLCDDDEVFVDDVSDKIASAYDSIPEADIIIFSMKDRNKTLGDKPRRLKFIDTLKVSSWQISFRRDSIIKKKIVFDPVLGAGTKNGAGEENKFLLDCLKNHLTIYYVPTNIATVAQEASTWFRGYTEEYFYNRGGTTRYIYGAPFALFYAIYFVLTKRNIYKDQISTYCSLRSLLKGIYRHELSK